MIWTGKNAADNTQSAEKMLLAIHKMLGKNATEKMLLITKIITGQ